MTLTTVIVDDEPLGRQAMVDLCARHGAVQVLATCASADESIEAVRRLRPDLLLLDVQMKPVNGLEVARSLLGEDAPRIVFVTAYDRYAVQAFELNALDYLLKPVDTERFGAMVARLSHRHDHDRALPAQRAALLGLLRDCLGEWRNDARDRRAQRFGVEVDGRVHFIDPQQVECAESDGNYVALTVGENVHTVRATLAAIEARLPPQQFLRLHRSVIVNTARIRTMERTFCGEFDVLLDNKRHFRTGRTYRRQIQEFLLRTKSQPD